jgi:L-ascorbate metabolism protein UlaG (beta-lactamase superfamily)
MNVLVRGICSALLAFFAATTFAAQVEVLWLGHATTRITSVTGKVILIDPFVTKNPMTPAKYKDLAAIGEVDAILVTHGHGDHVQDLKELAKMTGATVVAPYEFAWNTNALGITDPSKTIGMNKGGTVTPIGRDIKIHMVPAEHSSSVDLLNFGLQERGTGQPRMLDGGPAVGYVVELENGFKIYHSGDTHVFGDMALIRELYAPDLALVCIGGHFTMDPAGAAYALRELIKPKQVIPIHYGTFPIINRTPAELKAALGDAPIQMLDVKPGEAIRF